LLVAPEAVDDTLAQITMPSTRLRFHAKRPSSIEGPPTGPHRTKVLLPGATTMSRLSSGVPGLAGDGKERGERIIAPLSTA
jgi:hypothetical protein